MEKKDLVKKTDNQWRLCKKGGYDQRVILILAIGTVLALVSGIVAILITEDVYLRTTLAFIFGGLFSVSLRSLVAEVLQYFRRNQKTHCECGGCRIGK